MLPPIWAEFERHTQSVLDGSYVCRTESCPHCDVTGSIRRHAVRERTFLVVVGLWVHCVRSVVCRYLCTSCGRTFTDYPAFALPHKRYVVATLLAHAGAYLHDDAATYRSSVSAGTGAPTFYGSAQAGSAGGEPAIDDRALAPSTPWRWMAWLAAMTQTASRAKRLIREATSRLLRSSRLVARRKARSDRRRAILLGAADLIATAAAYSAAFPGSSIFTELATHQRSG